MAKPLKGITLVSDTRVAFDLPADIVVDGISSNVVPTLSEEIFTDWKDPRVSGPGVRWEMDWTQHNMMQLAHCQTVGQSYRYYPDMRVLSRAIVDYPFPGRFRPYHHQSRIVNLLTTNPRAYCFAGMGTGKTAAAIWSAEYLRQLGLVRKILVVCPKTILYAAWHNDLRDLLPNGLHDVRILDGSRDARLKRLQSGGVYHVTNYEGVCMLTQELHDQQYDLIIVDESTAYKTYTTKRWKALRAVVRDEAWMWALTGTPCPQGPEDAYGQARLLTPWTAPRTVSLWRDQTMITISKFIRRPKADWHDKVHAILQPAIRISKEEAALNLPPKVSSFRDVPLSKGQADALALLKKDYQVRFNNGELAVTAANAAVLFVKMQQIFTGAVYADAERNTDTATVGEKVLAVLDNKAREEALVDVIRETQANVDEEAMLAGGSPVAGKTLVFVPFRHAAARIAQVLTAEGITHAVINGDTPGAQRGEILRQFQTLPDPQVIVAIPNAFSHGVTATAASTIVWYGAPTRTEVYLQANNRIDRPGQTQHMNIIHLCSGGMEQRYYDNLINNENNQEQVLALFSEFIA